MKKQTLINIALILALTLASVPAYAGGRPDRESARGGAASGGGGGRVEGGELRLGSTTEPVTLDPLNPANTADGRSILFNVFEGLVKPAPDGGFLPAIAEKYGLEQNGLVYAFTLRRGVKFHDGSVVTAEDVEFSLNTAIKAGFSGFDRIEKVAVTAEGGINITLKEPDIDFLPYLTVGVVPKNNGDRERKPIGTGPYAISSYTAQQSLVLVKNQDYWQPGLPHLDRITIIFVADSDSLLLALQGGNIDSASISGSLLQQLDPNRFDYVPGYSNAVQLLALNNAVKPLEDLRVRQALNYGVDTKEIIDAAFYGQGEPSGSPLIPGLSRYYETSLKDPYPADPAKARSLLAAAGYGNGFPLEITVAAPYVMHVDTAQVIVNQLAKIGVTASIKLVDWATWLEDVYFGRHYQATIISLDAPQVSPDSFLSRYRSDSESNFVNFKSPAFDRVYDAARTEVDETNRIRLFKEAQRLISEEAASVYIQDILGFRVFVKGYAGVVNYPLYVFDLSVIYKTK
ncbi:MAG: ABC transporter substrate-binding protein [Spirochaetaceae bacterium]|jgi:peptide/nickel transport system substrate-binding protein|nr:ABC transporter substrate-binding protein [Spirochaetaceae bacterium]